MQKQDGLVKYQCFHCENEFIVGEKASEKVKCCPFCKDNDIEPFVMMEADHETNQELGCMGIYYDE